jgi:hypothetical protein
MEDKIAKLQAATLEAKANMEVCKEALELAEKGVASAKDKYRNLLKDEQETLQVNDTELPELLETHVRAKNVYETAQARFTTNKRYLEAFQQKNGA